MVENEELHSMDTSVCMYHGFLLFCIYVGMYQFMFLYIYDENENKENNRVIWSFSVFC